MTAQQQRFCPLCDRAFEEGEAVLRCEGCGVMHHPACWVRNNGCVTQTEHKKTPIAQAYTGMRPIGGPVAHPGEGIRVAGAPARLEPSHDALPPTLAPTRDELARPGNGEAHTTAEDDTGPVIGASLPRPPARLAPQSDTGHVPETVTRPSPPRRYQPPPGEPAARKPMPKVYGRHRILDYWYVPVAVLVAVVVAGGVIWASEQLWGGGGEASPAPGGAGSSAPAASLTTTVRESATVGGAGATATPAASTAAGKFRTSEAVLVRSPGECLNLRPAPGLGNAPIGCLEDGAEITVRGGPQTAEQIVWWNVSTAQGDGWVAEDYIAKKP